MKFFILAGGYGKRVMPLSMLKPKPAFPLYGTPLIKILCRQLKKAGFNNGFVNLHHKPDIIKESIGRIPGLSIEYLYEQELSGSKILAHAAGDMAENDVLLVANGDVFVDFQGIPFTGMLDRFEDRSLDGLLLVRETDNPGYSSIITTDGFFQGVQRGRGGPDNPDAPLKRRMYTGVALLRRRVVRAIEDTNFFNTLERHGFTIKTVGYNGAWLDIGTPRLYFEADLAYKDHIRSQGGGCISTINSLSPDVLISTGSRVSDCIIWENTEVHGKTVLNRCIVTGNMELRDVYYSDSIIYSTGGAIEAAAF